MLRKGMFLADRYEIIEQIGTGGMSDVYKAKCHKLNRYVAIKVMKAEFSQDKNFVSKFIIEAQSAAGLTHPNVVSVYDVGDENGIYYIVMELVEGITLKKYIEKKGRLTSKEAVSIAIQVAQGMEAAHSHHIIHRDIKPQNIIISKEGKVKVTDFGIARAASSQTISSSAMGSVHYISPEQARGGYSDEKSDIYSFGITLYEMLTGTVPFDGDSTVSVAVQHIQDEILPLSRAVDGVPISVDRIVAKCTQKKTERRYQNATELIADLKKSLVMPDVNFVNIDQPYDAQEDILSEDSESSGFAADKSNEAEDDYYFDETDDIDDLDEADEIDDDEYRKPRAARRDENDEDESGDKLDAVMKWVGIGIVTLVIIIMVFIAVKLASVIGGGTPNQPSDNNQTVTAESTTVDPSTLAKVPAVIGFTEEEAKSALKAVNLGSKVTRQPSDTVAEGLVISQSQPGGALIAKNSTVTISISTGSTAKPMINVIGKTEEQAVSEIKNAGFASPVIEYEYSDTVEQGLVIRQSPSANASVKSGDTIKIFISRGKETKMVRVPNVVNMSESQARQTLDAHNLNVAINPTTVMNDKIPYGYVAAQDYSEGKEVPEGQTITLTMSIGLGFPTVTVPVPDQTQPQPQAPVQNGGN